MRSLSSGVVEGESVRKNRPSCSSPSNPAFTFCLVHNMFEDFDGRRCVCHIFLGSPMVFDCTKYEDIECPISWSREQEVFNVTVLRPLIRDCIINETVKFVGSRSCRLVLHRTAFSVTE